jgi:hypothetical protein
VNVSSRLVAGALLLTAAAACSNGSGTDDGLPAVVVVSFQHSASDRAEEQQHIAAFESRVLPSAAKRRATVVVFAAGAAGFTAPRVLAQADLSTAHDDGGNPELAKKLVGSRVDGLVKSVREGLAGLPYAQATDVFGGATAAANFLGQFHAKSKSYIAFGDELANVPSGCVLGMRDLSASGVGSLLRLCAPVTPDFRGVRVALLGAGYSVDSPLPTSTAEGLERVLRAFYVNAGADVAVYSPVALAPVDPAVQ